MWAGIRTSDAAGTKLVAIVTGDALAYAANTFGMWNVVTAVAARGRHRTVGAYTLH